MMFEWLDLVKLLAAALAGALIGLERELSAKPAGLRTNIMICLGAAMFTIMSDRLAEGHAVSDRARVAAQIVTGVGFLGAGAIIHLRRSVLGLTTAATIWVDASVGMAFGAGEFILGTVGAVLTTMVLFALGFVESRLARWRTVGRFEAEIEVAENAKAIIKKAARASGVRTKTWAVTKRPDVLVARFKAYGPVDRLKKLERQLMDSDAVRVLKRL